MTTQYKVKDPSGTIHIIAGPDDATPDEIMSQAKSLVPANNVDNNHPILNAISSAIGQTPLGMAAQAGNAVNQGIGYLLDKTGIPVGDTIQQGAQQVMQASKAAGIAGANLMANSAAGPSSLVLGALANRLPPSGTAENIMQAANTIKPAMNPNYQPKNIIEKIGSFVGENVPVAAGLSIPIVGPMAGAAAMGVQQAAQSGKVSPIPMGLGVMGSIGIAAQKMANIPNAQELVIQKTNDLIDNFNKYENDLKNKMEFTKNALQINKTPQEQFNYISNVGEGRPLKQLVSDFNDLKKSDLSNTKKLQGYLDMDQELNDQINWKSPNRNMLSFKKDFLHPEMEATGPRGQELQKIRSEYSNYLQLKGDLTDSLLNREKAPYALQRIAKGDVKGALTDANSAKLGALKQFEKVTGTDVFSPIQEAIKKQNRVNLLKRLVGPAIGTAAPPLGFLYRAMQELEK